MSASNEVLDSRARVCFNGGVEETQSRYSSTGTEHAPEGRKAGVSPTPTMTTTETAMTTFDVNHQEASYAWLLTKDRLSGPDETSRKGTVGPHNAPDALIERLNKGDGVKWRCRDDDGETYYEGRLVFSDPTLERVDLVELGPPSFKAGTFCVGTPWDEDAGFGPLWDFAGPDAGAVTIEFRNTERKVWAVL